ncbi:hypothetical protein FQZ97_778350 [compost metagenome]
MAPAALARATATASSRGTKSSNMAEPIVVRTPAVKVRSLTEYGTPCSGPNGSPLRTAASASRAAASA